MSKPSLLASLSVDVSQQLGGSVFNNRYWKHMMSVFSVWFTPFKQKNFPNPCKAQKSLIMRVSLVFPVVVKDNFVFFFFYIFPSEEQHWLGRWMHPFMILIEGSLVAPVFSDQLKADDINFSAMLLWHLLGLLCPPSLLSISMCHTKVAVSMRDIVHLRVLTWRYEWWRGGVWGGVEWVRGRL